MKQKSLPDVILLDIFIESDVSTLKSLRFASRSFCALIAAYGNTIASNILSGLYPKSLTDVFRLQTCGNDPINSLFDIDRRIKLARWMAALSLRDHLPGGESCESWGSDELVELVGHTYIPITTMWEHITVGLGVMWRLSEIARFMLQEELQLDLTDVFPISKVTRNYGKVSSLENDIRQAQIDHVLTLSSASQQGLWFALGFCVRILSWSRRFEFLDQEFPKVISAAEQHIRTKWVWWFVAREGPQFIARAWQSEEGRIRCTHFVADEMLSRTQEQKDIENESTGVFYHKLLRMMPTPSRLFMGEPPGDPMLVAEDHGESLLKEHMKSGFQDDKASEQVSLVLGRRAYYV